MVREKLKRNGHKDGHEQLIRRRNREGMIRAPGHLGVSIRDEGDYDAAARLHFLNVRLDLFVYPVLAREHDDRQIFVDKGYRAVFHLTGRISFRVDVRYFLQFQRAFQRDREVRPPPKIEEISGFEIPFRDLLDRGVFLETALDERGDMNYVR